MKNFLFVLIALSFSLSSYAQNKSPYKIYNSKGKEVSYKKMMKELNKSDVLMYGELHNSALTHWLQLEMTKDLDENNDLILGAEMLEADNQDELDDYLSGAIDSEGLDTLARLWPNYTTDYAPLVNYAKAQNLKFIATNIPRRFANKVYKGGFEALDSLTTEEKTWIAPLPFPYDSELATYKEILVMMGEHGTPRLVMAQASKDATMAHFILTNYQAGSLFIHYNGAFHSDYYEGIMWYMKNAQPELVYKSVSTVTQVDISSLEKDHYGKADFIICVDEDMTVTY